MDDGGGLRLGLTEWIVLALVDEEPRHGFATARELEAGAPIGQVWTVSRPLVYRACDRLHAAGLIQSSGTEPGDKGPVRTVFATTETGRARLEAWLAEPVRHPRDVRTHLVAKLVLLARRERGRSTLAQRQLDSFAPVSSGLARKAEGATGADRVVALWRYESMRAITRLLEAVISDEAGGTGRA